MGALGEPFPYPVAPHPPPRRQRPGSGDWPPPASPGSSGTAQPEQEGKGRRGPGRRRKAAAAAANPAGWLAVTEIGRTGSGGGRRGLARGWLGSAQLGVCVCVSVCVQSRVPGAARGRCSAAQGQTPRAPPLLPHRDQSLPRREWGTAGDAAGPTHASASSPAEVGKG